MAKTILTPEQQVEVERYSQLLLQIARREAARFGELIATSPDNQLLGKTEFALRDLLHQVGAAFLAAALNERKKGGTAGRVSPVPSVKPTPS
jgi:hypothetical protein